MGLSAAVLVPLITTAVAGAANYVDQKNTLHDRQNILMDAMRRKRQEQQSQDKQTAALIHKVGASTPAAAKSHYDAALQQVLGANQPHATAPLNQPGAVSGAYQNQVAQTGQQIHDYGSGQADALASMAAPKLQRQNEGYAMQHYQEHLNQFANKLRGQDWLTKLRLEGVQPDPWVAALGSLASGAANAYGASAGQPMSYQDYYAQQAGNSAWKHRKAVAATGGTGGPYG